MDAVDKMPEFVRAKDFAEMTGLAMSTVIREVQCTGGKEDHR